MQYPLAFHKGCGGRVLVKKIVTAPALIEITYPREDEDQSIPKLAKIFDDEGDTENEETISSSLMCEDCNANLTILSQQDGNLINIIEARNYGNKEVIELESLEE